MLSAVVAAWIPYNRIDCVCWNMFEFEQIGAKMHKNTSVRLSAIETAASEEQLWLSKNTRAWKNNFCFNIWKKH